MVHVPSSIVTLSAADLWLVKDESDRRLDAYAAKNRGDVPLARRDTQMAVVAAEVALKKYLGQPTEDVVSFGDVAGSKHGIAFGKTVTLKVSRAGPDGIRQKGSIPLPAEIVALAYVPNESTVILIGFLMREDFRRHAELQTDTKNENVMFVDRKILAPMHAMFLAEDQYRNSRKDPQ